MAVRSGQQVPHKEDAWWKEPGEGYWRALLDQGEIVQEPVPPADPLCLYRVSADPETEDFTWAPPEQDSETQGDKWEIARAAIEQRTSFCLPVVGANRGGLTVEWNGLLGFVPASHLKGGSHTGTTNERASALALRIGESLTLCLIEVDEDQNRLVFSERAATTGAGSPTALLQSLRPGDVCFGRILNLTSFGAFVDLGGIEGLIHVSEISWDHLEHPGDLLHTGDEVRVRVVGVNPEEGRVALSLKRMRPNPWEGVESRYRVGQIVDGDITGVVSFGAFVRLEEGLEGLIHVSELVQGSVTHPRQVVCEGDRVRVRVLAIDTHKRRLGLSLRQAHDGEPPA